MNKSYHFNKANLAEAQAAMAKLLPNLPMPRVSEQLDCGEIQLPQICIDTNLPWQEHPWAIIESLNPFVRRLLPDNWLAAYDAHIERSRKSSQLVVLHPRCRPDEPTGLESVDGVVAGVLLMSLRPLPGALRQELLPRCLTHWWGAYFAARGLVMAGEMERLLRCISNDPRLVTALWLANPEFAEPLVPVAMGRSDLWSSIIALSQPLSDLWLGRVAIQAEHHQLSAVTALVLQPAASSELKARWINRLRSGHPRLAYLAVRWSRFTWAAGWEQLRDELKSRACSDLGLAWFHWHRDIDQAPAVVDEALRQRAVEVLWQAELAALTKHHGQYLHQQMLLHPDQNEARLMFDWLQRRLKPRP